MAISAALVKELRERTGAGMMECKKALVETGGDLDAAVEHMRKAGLAKADKKAGRVAAEGRVEIQVEGDTAAIAEVNCETDFVAGSDDFRDFVAAVTRKVLEEDPADLEALLALPLEGDKSVNEVRQERVAKIGENIQVRRFARLQSGHRFGLYTHGTRIGVLVEYTGGDEELGKDLAMHIAASRPICVAPADVPAEILAKEREIFAAQARDSGKPEDIIDKMVEGRIRKFLAEVTLLGQPFVKNPDVSVEKLLAEKDAEVIRFLRFEVGEGIEKKSENFADEVMAQVRGG